MFALLLKDRTGTVFLRHGQDLLLPLFTEDTNVLTYATKTNLSEFAVEKLELAADVGEFISSPPNRGGSNPDFIIVLDPMDNSPHGLISWSRMDFLALLAMY